MEFDPLEFYQKSKKDYPYDNDLPIGKNLIKLINKSFFNCPDIELIATYSLLSSRISQCLPILALIGKQGTGKSTILELIRQIRGIDYIFAVGQSTYASLRNYSNEQRYDHLGNTKEGAMMLLDNLHSNHLIIGDYFYNFLLTGYDLKTSKCSISLGSGKNQIFDTFSPKTLTTIHPINQLGYLELNRRLLVVNFKKQDPLFSTNLQQYNLSNFKDKFYQFWNNDRYYEYVNKKTILETLIQKSKILSSYKDIALDLLSTALITGIFDSTNDLLDYYDFYFNNNFNEINIINQLIIEYLNLLIDKKFIPFRHLHDYFKSLKRNGAIDETITFKQFKEIFISEFDYKLTKEGLKK